MKKNRFYSYRSCRTYRVVGFEGPWVLLKISTDKHEPELEGRVVRWTRATFPEYLKQQVA